EPVPAPFHGCSPHQEVFNAGQKNQNCLTGQDIAYSARDPGQGVTGAVISPVARRRACVGALSERLPLDSSSEKTVVARKCYRVAGSETACCRKGLPWYDAAGESQEGHPSQGGCDGEEVDLPRHPLPVPRPGQARDGHHQRRPDGPAHQGILDGVIWLVSQRQACARHRRHAGAGPARPELDSDRQQGAARRARDPEGAAAGDGRLSDRSSLSELLTRIALVVHCGSMGGRAPENGRLSKEGPPRNTRRGPPRAGGKKRREKKKRGKERRRRSRTTATP